MSFRARWSWGLGFSALVACSPTNPSFRSTGAVAAAPLLPPDRPEIEAERIRAEFTLLDLPLGDAVIQVCPKTATRAATVETRIRAAALIRAVRRLEGEARTELGSDDASPSKTAVAIRDGERTRSYRITYRAGAFDYEHTKTGAEPRRGTRALPAGAPIHDLHSALLMLRAWKPRLDEEAQFHVVLGRHLWRVHARAAGRKVILVQGSPRVTTRIDGEAARLDEEDPSDPGTSRRLFSLWFEETGRAVPVHLTATTNYGDVTMALTRYESSPEICGAPPSP